VDHKPNLFRFLASEPFALIIHVLSPLAFAAQDDINDWPKQATTTIKQQEKSLQGLTTENTKVEILKASLKEISKGKTKAQEGSTETDNTSIKNHPGS